MTEGKKWLLIIVLFAVAGCVALGNGMFRIPTTATQAASSITLAVPQVKQRHAQRDTHSYSVVGKPTLTIAFINRVLSTAGSPAAGKGQALYNLGVKYGIDPAFALAFFRHESSFGQAGEASSTLSLGNLRCIPDAACLNTSGQTCQPNQSCYAAFPAWEAGFEAWYKLIRTLYINVWKLTTIDQIIPRYAPPSDNNNDDAYIASLKHAIDTWRTGKVVLS